MKFIKILVVLMGSYSTVYSVYAKSPNENVLPPTVVEMVGLLFENLDKTFSVSEIDFRQNCKKRTVGCLLQGVLIGFAISNNLKEHKKGQKRWSQHGWSNTSCVIKMRQQYMVYVNNNPLYKRSFHKVLLRLKANKFWECTFAWGVSDGKNHWSQELRFSVTVDKKQLIKNSMAAMNTP